MLILPALNNLKNPESGMTLLETMIALILVGILSALGLPNLFSTLAKSNLNQALDITKATIQDSQRQAIRKGEVCSIYFDTSSQNSAYKAIKYNVPTSSTSGSCISNGTSVLVGTQQISEIKLPENVNYVTNLTDNKVNFSFQGLPGNNLTGTANKAATIVLYSTGVANRKCIVISPILGLIRSGTYTSTNLNLSSGNPENSCQTQL